MVALPPRLSARLRAPGAAWVVAFASLAALSGLLAAVVGSALPLLVAPGVAAGLAALADIRRAFYATVAAIALSVEVQFGSLGTDLPVEPLLVATAGLTLVYLVARARHLPARLGLHPVSLALLAHLAWIGFTSLTSAYPVTSVKFLAAKSWYVLPCYFLAAALIARERRVWITTMAWYAVPLIGVLAYCLLRHASYGFSFADVERAMSPFFRGHVNYAALASITLPLLIAAAALARAGSAARWTLGLAALLAAVAVYTSYTRAAYVALGLGLAWTAAAHFRLTRVGLVGAAVVLATVATFLVSDNRFFGLAPDYNKTVTHRDFDNLLEATYKLEDISTMERLYRWVAGGYMTVAKPLLGFGPGNFYRYYRGYALEEFRTYVSDNPEQSGVHNYLLMTLVEQGWPGLLIFLTVCALGLIAAERAYHRARDRQGRVLALAAGCSLVVNLSFQLINDLLESDKSGTWFFLCLGLVVALELRAAPAQRRA